MEKRSRRHIRDLVALAASQGLSQNEIGCARISMMARSTNAPFKGRIQKRKTNRLQIIKSSLQRTAGPYKSAISGPVHRGNRIRFGTGRTTRPPTEASAFAMAFEPIPYESISLSEFGKRELRQRGVWRAARCQIRPDYH